MDVIFLFRHDDAKCSRLLSFLAWKDIRKSTKDDDKNATTELELSMSDTVAAGESSIGENTASSLHKKMKSIPLPWGVASMYSVQSPEVEGEENHSEEMSLHLLQRLKEADDRTRDMSQAEYINWSECRHASFTWRKAKVFYEWAGLNKLREMKYSEDLVDVLGYLGIEVVRAVSKESLKAYALKTVDAPNESQSNEHHHEIGLFAMPGRSQSPLKAEHIHEAFRRLQQSHPKGKFLSSQAGQRASFRMPLKLI